MRRVDTGKKKELKCIMQGWLEKQRRKSYGWLDMREFDMRWFRIQELQGSDQNEFALCYYGGKDEKEARGWIYLRDITEIFDEVREKERIKVESDVLSFTVVSIGRTITMHTNQQIDTIRWLQALVDNCPQANTIRIMLPVIGKRTVGGLITPASGKADSSKSKADDKSSWERPVAEESEDGNESRRSLTEDTDEAAWFEGLGGSRSKKDTLGGKSDSHISLEDTLRDQSANYNKDKDKDRNKDREDHRKMGSKKAGVGTDSATTSRLHRYISGPSSGRNSANNSDSDGQPVSGRQNSNDASPRLQQSEMKETNSVRSTGDGTFDSDRETEHNASSSNSHSTSIDEEVEQIALTTRRVVNSSRNRAKEIRMQQRQQQSKEEETTENKQEEEPSSSSSSSSAAPTRRGKGAPLPPPSSSSIYTAAVAKPRRAKDLEEDEEGDAPSRGGSGGRISVDAFLAQSKPQGTIEDDTEDVDIKAEVRKYSNSVAQSQGLSDRSSVGQGGSQEVISGGRSRPPRAPAPAPVGSRAPYSSITQLSSGAASITRNGTPPRRAADPGAKTDANFVNEDWDADSPAGRGMWKADNKPTSAAPRDKAGVKEDANWLDEDFDD